MRPRTALGGKKQPSCPFKLHGELERNLVASRTVNPFPSGLAGSSPALVTIDMHILINLRLCKDEVRKEMSKWSKFPILNWNEMLNKDTGNT